MEQVTFARCTKRLDKILGTIAVHAEREADDLMYSMHIFFLWKRVPRFVLLTR